MSFELPPSDDIIAATLAEDLGVAPERILEPSLAGASLLEADVTTSAVVPTSATFAGRIVCRQRAVVCGLPLVARLYDVLVCASKSWPVECFPLVAEGALAEPGTPVMEIEGPAAVVLAGERSALNFMMTLSGIATEARCWQEIAGERVRVVDTRKTFPGMRALSKYAVAVGGAGNHRAGLWDMVLIKDNHLRRAGGVAAAIAAARAARPGLTIECEADSVAQAAAAARGGADIVLLDNMDDVTLAQAVRVVHEAAHGRTCLTEASGGITRDRVPAIVAAGVDRISTSALTFARPVDFGLDEVEYDQQSAGHE